MSSGFAMVGHAGRRSFAWRGPVAGLLLLLSAACTEVGPTRQQKKEAAEAQAEGRFRMGAKYLNEGESRRALGELLKAVELKPRDAVYRNSLGLAYFSVGEELEAEGQFLHALKLDPHFTDVRNNLGMAYAAQEKFDLAIESFQKAIADPTYLTPEKVYLNWGNTLATMGEPGEAGEMYRKSLDVNPNYARGHYELGLFLEEQGDVPGAIEELLMAWPGLQKMPDLNLKLGELYMEKGDAPEARRYLELIIEDAPESYQAGKARAYLERMKSG